ncbi:YHS domain-containing protein [Endozoicomonas sp. SM1973]|uniref:YHS domain-containing protein n=1 Tax=Spartinivicinus marinus TaxID=2994442 RepID=A0A853I4X8_9GAMM|nr:YHS domain-containing (seleno)protein [Spartinivicinus marinus]MCX4029119.1 YHS domain-containing protein [Spartinivicinus marinus]NYZ67739.1 YHS domain-containing protein [Spartinivicinus marinus]
MKRWLVVLFSLWINSALAGDAIYTGFFSNKAVSGYDTVAYFTQGKPVKGKSQYKYTYQGADWFFASQEHLDLFKQSPEKYAPQYGGFCAWAVAAKNSRASADPKNWKIVDGKLYLNYDDDVQQKWLKDIPGFVVKGDKNWPKLLAE